MMRRRRGILAASSVAMVGALLMMPAAFAAPTKTIQLWTLQLGQSFKPWVQQGVAAFHKKYPGFNVQWVDVPGSDINEKYLANYAAGTAPALANLDYGAFTEMADEVIPLNKYLTKAQQNAFPAAAIDPLTVNGKIMAIPFYDSGTALPEIYNMKLLNKAGITTPPQTMAQFYQDGLKLHKAEPNVYMAVGGAVTPGPGVTSTFQNLNIYSANDRKIVYDTPQAVKVWKQLKVYWDGGVWDPDSISNVNQLQLFLEGTTAQYGQGMETQLEDSWGPIKKYIKIGPPLYGPSDTFGVGPAFFWVVSKETKYPLQATQLAMSLMSVKEQLFFSKLTDGDVGPVSKAAIKDPAFYSHLKGIERTYAILQAKSSSHGRVIPALPLPDTLQNDIGEILQTQLNNVLISNESVPKALKAAQTQAQAALNKYWASVKK